MKTISNSVAFFIVLTIIITTCKKYEEGPLISFRTANSRISGIWELESFIVDGIDSSATMKSQVGECTYGISPQGESSFDNTISGGCPSAPPCPYYCFSGRWNFNNNKRVEINIWSSPNGVIIPFLTTDKTIWRILRLTNKEMWITTDYNGKTYEIRLNKIRNTKKD